MKDPHDGGGRRRARWALTAEAFESLLSFIDADRQRASEKYELLRGKLVRFFASRKLTDPEALANSALDRIAARLVRGDGVEIENLNAYAYGVAKLIQFESHKNDERERRGYEDFARMRRDAAAAALAGEADDAVDADERLRDCFDSCLSGQGPESASLILEYYGGGAGGPNIKARKALASRLDVAPSALRLRAHRIRARIEKCVTRCLAAARSGEGETE